MMVAPLTVGFVVDEKNELPAWECLMLQKLAASDFIAKVILIILPSKDEKTVRSRNSLGFLLFNRFENAWFNKIPDAKSITDLDNIEDHLYKLVTVKITSENDVLPFEPDLLYLSLKMKYSVDFKPPPFGVWRVEFGNDPIHNNLPAFWEVMNQEVITKAWLTVKVNKNNCVQTAYTAIALTVPFSVKNNFNSIAFKASEFLIARLRELCLTGPKPFFEKCREFLPEIKSLDKKEAKRPGSILMLRLFTRNIFSYLAYKIKKVIRRETFILLYARGKLEMNSVNISNYTKLLPPAKSFWADPFVIKKENDHFIFFEECSYPEWKGRLAVMKINAEGVCSEKKVVLEKHYHLSYPFLFEMNGNYYLIPESSANRTVDLYHCKEFPYEWEFLKCLLSGVVLQDSTLFFYQETWWLFATTKNSSGSTSNDLLMIYYCSDIFSGNWQSHAGNPVITDVSNCRPAGKIFMEDGKIFRPAQNNASRQYGYSIKINEIEILNPTEYKEKLIHEISPGNFREFVAIHTINADGDLIVIDGIMAES
jgi:hypothetical protein